jgi:3-oxoacyl-[acyl-carrier-protein] synthase-3
MVFNTPLNVEFAGFGSYVPEQRLTNDDLERMVDTSDEWIMTRTGIKERRIAAPEQAASDLATEAGRRALEAAGVEPGEIDAVICATITPDHIFPATACMVASSLGAAGAFAYDLLAACSGFVFACSQAAGMIESGMCRNVLVIGTECLSRITDYEDRSTCVLFGDGAGAAVLRHATDPSRQLLMLEMGADGASPEILWVPSSGSRLPASPDVLQGGEQFIKLQGREVFKIAVTKLIELIQRVPETCGIAPEDIDLIIPHQMNSRIIETSCRRAGIGLDRVYVNIDRYGNTSAASVPIATAEAIEEGRLQRGNLALMLAFGGGLTWGSLLFRY